MWGNFQPNFDDSEPFCFVTFVKNPINLLFHIQLLEEPDQFTISYTMIHYKIIIFIKSWGFVIGKRNNSICLGKIKNNSYVFTPQRKKVSNKKIIIRLHNQFKSKRKGKILK